MIGMITLWDVLNISRGGAQKLHELGQKLGQVGRSDRHPH